MTSGAYKKSGHINKLITALKGAGYEVARRSNDSHFIMRCPERETVTIPAKLDSIHLAKKIAKRAGIIL